MQNAIVVLVLAMFGVTPVTAEDPGDQPRLLFSGRLETLEQ